MKPATPVLLACAAVITLSFPTKAHQPAAWALGQQGPPQAPPSNAPPSEPVQLHAPPPHPPTDFEGPQQPLTPRARVDAAKTRKDAEQLAALARQIPEEVDQISRGVLPKDVEQQLKEIQKLAKRLRTEITP